MPILNTLASVVNRFKIPGGITVERYTSDVDADGYATSALASSFAVDPAAIHPVQGKELLRLPEGDRTKEIIAVFTRVRLRTSYEGSNEMADRVLYTPQGESVQGRYVVTISEDWIAQSGHYRCICVREENG